MYGAAGLRIAVGYLSSFMNSLTMTILIHKIPPHLPLPASSRKKTPKGGITPLWQRGATCLREAASAKAGGRFSDVCVNSILRPLLSGIKNLPLEEEQKSVRNI
jgi:hypothetical protein